MGPFTSYAKVALGRDFVSEQIFVSRYSRASLSDKTSSDGALVRIGRGMGVIHPHPQLGDGTLEDHLMSLRNSPTFLARRALGWARAEDLAIRLGEQLWGAKLPESHHLVTALDSFDVSSVPTDASVLKIKIRDVDGDLDRLASCLENGQKQNHRTFRLRFDANEFFTFEQILRLSKNLHKLGLSDALDFIEDPTHFDLREWTELAQATGLRFACDRPLSRSDVALIIQEQVAAAGSMTDGTMAGIDVLVLKPSVHDLEGWIAFAANALLRVVVTHNMAHPVDVAISRWSASQVLAVHPLLLEVCGLNSSEPLIQQGAGWGLENLTAACSWEPV